MRRWLIPTIVVGALLGNAPAASADLSAFVGSTRTPSHRTVAGAALSVSLLVVGFEFEYADTREDTTTDAPGLRTGMFNLEIQTPPISRLRIYGTIGGGLYRERLGDHQETAIGTNVGGGVKVRLVGPLGLRVDYRVFSLAGDPLHPHPHRVYAGLNLAF